jgi:hypothetical protein
MGVLLTSLPIWYTGRGFFTGLREGGLLYLRYGILQRHPHTSADR